MSRHELPVARDGMGAVHLGLSQDTGLDGRCSVCGRLGAIRASIDADDGRRRQFVGESMSTRSQLRFVQRIEYETDDGETKTDVRIAQVYRHADGYPDAVLPALQRLQTLLRTTRTERGPSYAAATFVHVEKCRAMRFYLDRGHGRSITADSPADVIDARSWVALEQPTFLMGYGVENPADGIHGDEEYCSVVELPDPDVINPGETGDWRVKVSEHCGFPRWDGPTEAAFERATWQFEGSVGEAVEELVTVPVR